MTKADHSVDRLLITRFCQIINIGPAFEKDFEVLGISTPQELIGRDPLKLYLSLCEKTGVRQDPCVLDVLIATVNFMDGNPPKKWWEFTSLRKEKYGQLLSDADMMA